MRYPLNSDSVRDPIRYARGFHNRNPDEEMARAIVACQKGQILLTKRQAVWSAFQSMPSNPKMGLPYFPFKEITCPV